MEDIDMEEVFYALVGEYCISHDINAAQSAFIQIGVYPN